MLPSRTAKIILALLAFTAGGTAFAAEGHGVSPTAEAVFHLGPLPVTNSMLTSWFVALVLIVVIRVVAGGAKLIPTRGQAVIENMVEGLRELVTPIVGSKVINAAFPLLIALFIFILAQNWFGLLPGVGTILVSEGEGKWTELIRPGNADMNGTVGLAVVAIFAWLYLILRYAGPMFILRDLFGNKADKREVPAAIYYPLFVVFFFVGILEIVSMLFRPVSLSFRLFGNVFGGENLLHSVSGIFPWILPLPAYFMEVLVGFVQAFVFTLLVSVYIGLICNHGDDHGHEGGHGHDDHKEGAAAAH
jgi:F-type H+-transporting ATPase subunit a